MKNCLSIVKFWVKPWVKFLSLTLGLGLLSVCSTSVTDVLSGDQVRDVLRYDDEGFFDSFFLRSQNQTNQPGFGFNSVLSTEIAVQLELHDLSSSPPEQREAHRAEEPANAILTLRRKGIKRTVHTAAIDDQGRYEGYINLAAHQQGDYILSIHKPGYVSREIEVENLIGYARIDRVISMEKEAATVPAPDSPDTTDRDGDSIPDIYDAFPADPDRAFQRTFPENDFLTIAFEGAYPRIGDADYNDYVARYQITENLNAQNKIVGLYGIVEPVTMRTASTRLGFGIYIRFPQNQGTLTVRNTDYDGQLGGLREERVSDAADISVYSDTRDSISFVKRTDAPLPGICRLYNSVYTYQHSYLSNPCLEMYGHRAYFNVRFDTPVAPAEIDSAPYDPYLRKKRNTGYLSIQINPDGTVTQTPADYDIHLAGKEPLPNSGNPARLAESGFRDADGYPWALLVPGDWAPLQEIEFQGAARGRKHITAGYPEFDAWRTSGGSGNTDWYLHPQPNYIDAESAKLPPMPAFPAVDIVFTLGKTYTQVNFMEVSGFVRGAEGIQEIRYYFQGEYFDTDIINGNEFRFTVGLPESKRVVLHEVAVEVDLLEEITRQNITYQQKVQFTSYPEYAPDRILLRLEDETSQAEVDRVTAQLSGRIIHHIWKKLYVVGLPEDSDIPAKIEEAERETSVKYALPDSYIFPSQATPPGRLPDESTSAGGLGFLAQWGLDNDGGMTGATADADIDAPEAWNLTTGSRDVIVAVLDSGIELNEPLGDANDDGCPGLCYIDDDGDGTIDEGLACDDDEDGTCDEGIHPDLVNNIWQNPGEDSDGDGRTIEFVAANNRWELDPGDLNNQDDDGNGYIDDLAGYDFCGMDSNPDDSTGHGTHVSGILGAEGNNGMGVAGVNWQVSIMPLKILPVNCFNVDDSDDPDHNLASAAMLAILYAKDMGAHITNNSWRQYSPVQTSYYRREFNVLIQELSDLYASGRSTAAGREDILHVFGAGNERCDLTIPPGGLSAHSLLCAPGFTKLPTLLFPTYVGIHNKIVVAATNSGDTKPDLSNYSSTFVDIAAPGKQIYSTDLANNFRDRPGTSMAAPHVAGVAALIMAWQPGLRGRPLLVKDSILQSADTPATLRNTSDCPDSNGSAADCVVNGRRLNAYNALRASEPPAKVTGLTPTPGMEQMQLSWTVVASNVSGITLTYEVYRNGVRIQRGLTSANFTDTGLTPGTPYTYHVRAVKSNNIAGPFSDSVGASTMAPPPPPIVEHIAGHTCALVSSSSSGDSGSLYCWGRNDSGQLGDGERTNKNYAAEVLVEALFEALGNVTSITVGPYHTCAVRESQSSNGLSEIYCWGRNESGQLGDGTDTDRSIITIVTDRVRKNNTHSLFRAERVLDIQIGLHHTCALVSSSSSGDSGNLYCWGRNDYGQLGDETRTNRTYAVEALGNVTSMTVGPYHTCAVRESQAINGLSEIYCWGRNESGQLGDGTDTDYRSDISIVTDRVRENSTLSLFRAERVLDIQIGLHHTCALVSSSSSGDSGNLYCWGRNDYGQLGDGTRTNRTYAVEALGNVTSMTVGPYHTCAVRESQAINGLSEIYCWGRNESGQLGDGTDTDYRSDISIVTDRVRENSTLSLFRAERVLDIQIGLHHTCALVSSSSSGDSGDLHCWGRNDYGQLGDGTRTNRTYAVEALGNVTSMTVGPYHTCAKGLEAYPPKPKDIPNTPRSVYKGKGWQGIGDWLGNERISCRPFAEARSFVRSLKLSSQKEWLRYCRGELEGCPSKPKDIPKAPQGVYKGKEWKNTLTGWGLIITLVSIVLLQRPVSLSVLLNSAPIKSGFGIVEKDWRLTLLSQRIFPILPKASTKARDGLAHVIGWVLIFVLLQRLAALSALLNSALRKSGFGIVEER